MRIVLLAAPLLLAAAPSIVVSNGWSRATFGAGATAVGYLTVANHGATAERLIGAQCDGAATTTLHQTIGGTAMGMGGMAMDHMASLASVTVPGGGTAVFQPGGLHLMLGGMARPLRPGDTMACTLHFVAAGDIAVRLSVQRAGDTAYGPPVR